MYVYTYVCMYVYTHIQDTNLCVFQTQVTFADCGLEGLDRVCAGIPMILGLFWIIIRSLLTVTHTAGIPMILGLFWIIIRSLLTVMHTAGASNITMDIAVQRMGTGPEFFVSAALDGTVYIHTYIRIYIHTYIHTYVYTYIHAYSSF